METIDEKIERLIKDKKIKLDTKINGTINQHKIDAANKRDKNRVPLRVDQKTIILVKPENKNSEYRNKYKSKLEESRWRETRL